jgi:hypothetical protein
MKNNLEAQVRTELEEMKGMLEQSLNDVNVLLNKRYVKARAVRLRSRLDKIANKKVELRKKMLELEKNL